MINLLIKTGYPFASFRFPHEKEFINIVQNDRRVETFQAEDLSSLKGFVMVPFDVRGSAGPVVIRHDLSYSWSSAQGDAGPVPLHSKGEAPLPSEPTRQEYLQKIVKIQEEIRAGRVRKVVLSRPRVVKISEEFDFTRFFLNLSESYPAAFIFFVHLPSLGSWAGATPEVLLDSTGRYYETAALAGTLPLSSDLSVPEWPPKEREEQRIVSDYIREVLDRSGFPPAEVEGPHTVIAGKMAHLETLFRIVPPKEPAAVARLLAALHPTPAVCGYPRDEALRIILATEGYDRQYYTGYLGPWNTPHPSRLYVNLRSMQFLPGRREAVLYAGGGITAASEPEKEWQETELKLETLLSVLQKLPNFTG